MKEKVKEYILEHNMIDPGDNVWIAFSGGVDSCCLLHMLNSFCSEMKFELRAVHINHRLRGNESDRDEEFCRAVCLGYGIELTVYNADVKKIAAQDKSTTEEAGRKARYDIFVKHCDGKVALAHNMNDNAETVLMNLTRGSGMEGLGGIGAVNGRYIRPLLNTGREIIEQYCRNNKITHIEDSSNTNTVYFRNAIRLKAIPLLNDISKKNIVPLLARTAETVKRENEFVVGLVEVEYKKIVVLEEGKAIINNTGIKEIHPVLAARVVRKAIRAIKGDLKDIELKNTEILLDIIKKNKTGEAADFADGVRALVQFGKTIIYRKSVKLNYEYIMGIPGIIYIKERGLTLAAEITKPLGKGNPTENVHYFNYEKFKNGFSVRNRRNGDIIKPWKRGGTVKLKKYFIDKKVDRLERDKKLLIALGQSIAYIENMDYGKDFLPTDNEKAVKITIERRWENAGRHKKGAD